MNGFIGSIGECSHPDLGQSRIAKPAAPLYARGRVFAPSIQERIPAENATTGIFMSKSRIKVVIVEDHPGVRAGIRKLLQEAGDIAVIGEAEDGAQAIQLAKSKKPDIMLLDVELPVLRGDVVMKQIRESQPEVRVIAVSSYKDPSYIKNMLENGAAGYITKDEAPRMLLDAIRSVHEKGDTGWISPDAYKSSGATLEEPILTAREMDILKQILADRSEYEIAVSLVMDVEQVRKYLALLMQKFEVDSPAGLKDIARRILPPKSSYQDDSQGVEL